jgi:hypothetical protein
MTVSLLLTESIYEMRMLTFYSKGKPLKCDNWIIPITLYKKTHDYLLVNMTCFRYIFKGLEKS